MTAPPDEEQVERGRDLVDGGTAPSVTGFVQHVVSIALDDVTGWGAVLAGALESTGGPLTDDERAWLDGVLGSAPHTGEPAA